MALGRKTGGRIKGKNYLEAGQLFVVQVERALKAGVPSESLVNLVCRQLKKPEMCNPILLKLLAYKLGEPKANQSHDHRHVHVEMSIDDAKQIVRGYFGQLAGSRDLEIGEGDSDGAPEQDNELLPE